jgi:hypothetical protein
MRIVSFLGFGLREASLLNTVFRRVRKYLKSHLEGPPIHILFLLHDSTYLRNFDDSIRSLLRRGHRVTIAYPETKPGGLQRHYERRLFKKHGVDVRFAPRSRADRWQPLARFVRRGRAHLLYRKRVFMRATFLQDRIAASTPDSVRSLLESRRVRSWPRLTDLIFRVLEFAIPPSEEAKRFIAGLKPDVMLITPYVSLSTLYQVDYAKAAQVLGVPVGVPVFSWDNLTSKGVIQVRPDRLFVWNKTQFNEAVSLHKMPASRITITGGMRFSKFYGATPPLSRREFCESVGLDPSMPLITYLGSSRTIAPREHEFLWRWLNALRASQDSRLRGCNVYVRPHPNNPAIWDHWPDKAPDRVALWDGRGDDVSGVVNSVGQSVAVVGINTTAMLEAAALAKPVLTVLDDDLRAGQLERIHFHYLTSVAGGLVTVANTIEEHVGHLSAILDGDRHFAEKSETFARAFLRPPRPFDSPVQAFGRAVERLARDKHPKKLGRLLLQPMLQPVAEYLALRIVAGEESLRARRAPA